MAAGTWQSTSFRPYGEDRDPAYRLALRGIDLPLDDEFVACATAVFAPLLGGHRGRAAAGAPVKVPSEFDVFHCGLDGINLIEASAGTGKTWNICGLYLRLLLERDLEVQEILVVTFTNAATAELRERVRSRIVETLAWLQPRGRGSAARRPVRPTARHGGPAAHGCHPPAARADARPRAAILRRGRDLHDSRVLPARARRRVVQRGPALLAHARDRRPRADAGGRPRFLAPSGRRRQLPAGAGGLPAREARYAGEVRASCSPAASPSRWRRPGGRRTSISRRRWTPRR